jgi:LacI family transcriptional regulator
VATVSIRDVAARARVSIGTVSNTLNSPDKVSRKVQARVHQAISELGYVRNESARALKVGSSHEIGLIVGDLANPYYTDVARGADDAADRMGYVVSLNSSHGSPEREVQLLKRLATRRVTGILINPMELDDLELEELLGSQSPVVVFGRRSSRCSVCLDDVGGGRLVGEHLIAMGHRRLAFVGDFPDKIEGIKLAVNSASARSTTLQTYSAGRTQPGGRTLQGGYAVGQSLGRMADDKRPTGIACGNDLLAIGLLQALLDSGLRVPEDAAIVGWDDIDFAASARVPLTSIGQPREELGRVGIRLLTEELADVAAGAPHSHRTVVFSPELIVRESSDYRRR